MILISDAVLIRDPGRKTGFAQAIGSLRQISAYLIDKRGFPGPDL